MLYYETLPASRTLLKNWGWVGVSELIICEVTLGSSLLHKFGCFRTTVVHFNIHMVWQQEIWKPNYKAVKSFSSVKSFILFVLNLPLAFLCCLVLEKLNNHSLFPLPITAVILQTSIITFSIHFFSFQKDAILLYPSVSHCPSSGTDSTQHASAQQDTCLSNLFFSGNI